MTLLIDHAARIIRVDQDMTTRELYCMLCESFADGQSITNRVPIYALDGDSYEIVNGWILTQDSINHLTGDDIHMYGKVFSPGHRAVTYWSYKGIRKIRL
jgi:hypothetical protein